MKEYGIYINGKWVPSESGQVFETVSPIDGKVLATFPKGTAGDVHRAIDAAEAAFPMWKRTPAPKRGEILLRAAQLMRQYKQELGELVTSEMGKVIAEGKGDVQEAIDFMEYISGEGRRMLGETTPSELPNKFCMTLRQPIGVVGCITPWNFPMAIPTWKIGAALISGNTIVFKPSSLTPLCVARLIEILEEAGLPPGVINYVTGGGGSVGMEIVKNPRVKAISFTGGVPTGREIYAAAAQHLKPVELELGGKNPQIVMEDANFDLAIEGVLFGAFGTAGQRCTATSRLIIHEPVYDEVLGRLIERTRNFKIGNPLDPRIDVGPVADQGQRDSIMEYIEIGRGEANLALGGEQCTGGEYDKGYYIQPTIFETEHGSRISKEEIFGPVLSVIKAKDFEDAVRIANDIEYGLSSSIYTRDVNLAFRAVDMLETGITYINAPTIGAEVHLPFGGTKNTGNGGREAGTSAIDEFTEIKTVFVDYSNRLQKAQIVDEL
ncbi:MAG TPA: aldehyde dehydrogenase family protein [Aggregatilinea sp.]|uniref:aldehyde dehydrogenase family protein n=1 Tax=Aggregatilinea sp. TaxID=2806333 RepID=UPI002CDF979C|nr:aldehyde dehydrogenase family protein [Aggregatilinea sp.]HML23858.1 aldehyde dehydrogenase family protein [Aggregatilinea sp.]